MITQNPIIGRARKKIGNVYSRTLFGMNVLQTCPPPTKGKQQPAQIAACKSFAQASQLAYQVSASLLTYLFYEAPIGRSRRAEWCRQISQGRTKVGTSWGFNAENIQQLGANPKVSELYFNCVPASTRLDIPLANLSAVGQAITTEIPCLVLICEEANVCISLLGFTSIVDDNLVVENLSSKLVGKSCTIFPLWLVNMGTVNNPIYAYGSYRAQNAPS